MKRAERFFNAAAAGLLIAVCCCAVLFLAAIYFTVVGDRGDAAFCLLWGLSLDMAATGVRNVAADCLNEEIDEEKRKN